MSEPPPTPEGLLVMHFSGGYELDEFDGDFDDDEIRDGIKPELSPGEDLLWAGRPGLPRIRKIHLIPLLFVIVLTSLSGVSLAAMFGIFEEAVASPWVWITAFCLAPAALGSLIVLDFVRRTISWLACRCQLARTVYAVTDQRAIIARVGSADGDLQLISFPPGMIDGTTRHEYADGSGDLYFEGLEAIARGPVGFIGIRCVRRVDELIRETLIDPFPHW